MRRLIPLALLVLLCASCSQNPSGGFNANESTTPAASSQPATFDLAALAAIRAQAAGALVAHLPFGILDLGWGPGATAQPSGPYTNAAPEADAAALQALRSLAQVPASDPAPPAGLASQVAGAETDALKQLDGPRGGAYLLLTDAAHPPRPSAPTAVDAIPSPCATPAPGAGTPECLRRQVSDGLLAAWYATDTHMFFKVGETSTVYRPVDAITVGCALLVAGYQEHDEAKIQAGEKILDREMKVDLDPHYGLLYGLVTATAQGGHSVTDYNTHLADQAGAAEAMLEGFDASREQVHFAYARSLLQPFVDASVALRAPTGGYVTGFDLQSSGPSDQPTGDVLATLLLLQGARHYDRDDGGRFARLEEAAASSLATALASDRRQGGNPAEGLPATVPPSGYAARSGLATALAVVVLGDVARDEGAGAGPGTSPSP